MEYKGLQLNRFEHATFQIKVSGKVIYIDPFKLNDSQIEPADYVFITHEHFDHCSPEDIEKIVSEKTVIVASKQCKEKLNVKVKEIIYVSAGQNIQLDDLKVEVVPAYNLDKWRSPGVPYHPREENHVGYVIEIEGVRIYHAGDTDQIPEMSQLKKIDVAILPVSGTYVMTWQEAVEAAKVIKPKLAIPMHYGSIVGSLADAQQFKENLDCSVEII